MEKMSAKDAALLLLWLLLLLEGAPDVLKPATVLSFEPDEGSNVAKLFE